MIPVQNIYHMLAYAFQVLNEQGYQNLATESFSNTADLCAAILSKGVSVQIRRGLGREYIEKTESLSAPHGRIEISESVRTRSMLKRQLVCSYDSFSVNTYMNRIIKSTMVLLLGADISRTRKKELRRLLAFFGDIELLDVYTINWKMHYNRNNQTYQMLISVCYLVVKGLLQTNEDGTTRFMDFLDEQRMCRLYEKFILAYYRKEFPEISASASQIPWAVDDGVRTMLPVMQSDIMLTCRDQVLIIDAKYYSHTMQMQYDSHTLHSSNLYQIFTYVKNKEAELKNTPHEVSGMLLYARTDEAVQPDHTYLMSGNRISVRTLDLNCDFCRISAQLDAIAAAQFGGLKKRRV